MLGLLVWSSQSVSHAGLAHSHSAAGAELLLDDYGKFFETSKLDKKHHHHNAGDHTHDVPLQPALVRLGIDRTVGWRRACGDDVRSAVVVPPDPPPRDEATA
jgi:hypothetical protein